MKRWAAGLLIALAGCAPGFKQVKAERDVAVVTLTRCTDDNIALRKENESMRSRLRLFNQVEKDGTLRKLKTWEGDKSAPVTGTEEWIK